MANLSFSFSFVVFCFLLVDLKAISVKPINKINDEARKEGKFKDVDIIGDIRVNIRPAGVSNAAPISITGVTWPNGEVPYFMESSLSGSTKQTIKDALNYIEGNVSCVKFTELQNANHGIRDYISVFKGDGCWSYIGKNGGEQQLSIGQGCEYDFIIQHEFYHSLGFFHEQSRPDRNKYVRIFEDNILDGTERNFAIVNVTKTNTEYDPKSIMHYGNWAFSKNGLETIQYIPDPSMQLGGETLTNLDIKGLQTLYGCSVPVTTTTPEPMTTTTTESVTTTTPASMTTTTPESVTTTTPLPMTTTTTESVTTTTPLPMTTTTAPTPRLVFCKSGKRGTLRCPAGQRIVIKTVTIGKAENIENCFANVFNTDCKKAGVVEKLRKRCKENICLLKNMLMTYGKKCYQKKENGRSNKGKNKRNDKGKNKRNNKGKNGRKNGKKNERRNRRENGGNKNISQKVFLRIEYDCK